MMTVWWQCGDGDDDDDDDDDEEEEEEEEDCDDSKPKACGMNHNESTPKSPNAPQYALLRCWVEVRSCAYHPTASHLHQPVRAEPCHKTLGSQKSNTNKEQRTRQACIILLKHAATTRSFFGRLWHKFICTSASLTEMQESNQSESLVSPASWNSFESLSWFHADVEVHSMYSTRTNGKLARSSEASQTRISSSGHPSIHQAPAANPHQFDSILPPCFSTCFPSWSVSTSISS